MVHIDEAPVFDMGIIGVAALAANIHVAPTSPESATATLISTAFSNFPLGVERGAHLTLLRPDGRHVFRRLS